MATVLNRTTKQMIVSANTPDYPVVDWIINPDLSSVAGFASIYWVINGDVVSLMDAATRASVDAAILAAQRDATAAAMDQIENYARAFALVVMDEFNLHATRLDNIKSAVAGAGTFSAMKTAFAAIASIPQRTIANLKTALRNKLGT